VKAEDEMDGDNLTDGEVMESIVSAPRIDTIQRSTRPHGRGPAEKRYVIKGIHVCQCARFQQG